MSSDLTDMFIILLGGGILNLGRELGKLFGELLVPRVQHKHLKAKGAQTNE